MCGITGYIGNKEIVPILIEGLKRLEYRGYDSAGIAVLSDGEIKETKSVGKLINLQDLLEIHPLSGHIGIGHTRWATHGKPSDENAHPHTDCRQRIAVVHNGIIENYLELKHELEKEGHTFRSETDTEILAHLIEKYYQGDLLAAVRSALKQVTGSYAIGVICLDEPDVLIAARKDSPLVIGVGKGENYIASDIPAFLPYTKEAMVMKDNEVCRITKDAVRIFDLDGNPLKRLSFQVLWDAQMAEKGGYKHFMLKEIFEQPKVILDTLTGRLKDDQIDLSETKFTPQLAKEIKRIHLVACGTAYHAALIGKYLLEELAGIPAEAELASEFRYRNVILDKNTLVIAVSQSGETADTLAAVKKVRKENIPVFSITNVLDCSLSRESDFVLYTRAGIEIGVAATKTFTAQMTAFYLLALYLAGIKKTLDAKEIAGLIEHFSQIPQKVSQITDSHEKIKEISREFNRYSDFLYLGRHLLYPIALEGALKLKEISYIHAEGYAAGEMKHGPIALIDENCPVVAMVNQGQLCEKILSNIKEVKARDAVTIGIVTYPGKDMEEFFDHYYLIPETHYLFSPLLSIIPLQLLAYYISDKKGCDVDQPRNLAKSVTVE